MKSSRNIFSTGLASIGFMLVVASIILVAKPCSASIWTSSSQAVD